MTQIYIETQKSYYFKQEKIYYNSYRTKSKIIPQFNIFDQIPGQNLKVIKLKNLFKINFLKFFYIKFLKARQYLRINKKDNDR